MGKIMFKQFCAIILLASCALNGMEINSFVEEIMNWQKIWIWVFINRHLVNISKLFWVPLGDIEQNVYQRHWQDIWD